MDINVMIFNPHYWNFEVGISLNRYEEHDNNEKWIKRELSIGLLLLAIRFSIKVKREKV